MNHWITFESAAIDDVGKRILIKAENICGVAEITKHKTRVYIDSGLWNLVKGDYESVVKRIAETVVDV